MTRQTHGQGKPRNALAISILFILSSLIMPVGVAGDAGNPVDPDVINARFKAWSDGPIDENSTFSDPVQGLAWVGDSNEDGGPDVAISLLPAPIFLIESLTGMPVTENPDDPLAPINRAIEDGPPDFQVYGTVARLPTETASPEFEAGVAINPLAKEDLIIRAGTGNGGPHSPEITLGVEVRDHSTDALTSYQVNVNLRHIVTAFTDNAIFVDVQIQDQRFRIDISDKPYENTNIADLVIDSIDLEISIKITQSGDSTIDLDWHSPITRNVLITSLNPEKPEKKIFDVLIEPFPGESQIQIKAIDDAMPITGLTSTKYIIEAIATSHPHDVLFNVYEQNTEDGTITADVHVDVDDLPPK